MRKLTLSSALHTTLDANGRILQPRVRWHRSHTTSDALKWTPKRVRLTLCRSQCTLHVPCIDLHDDQTATSPSPPAALAAPSSTSEVPSTRPATWEHVERRACQRLASGSDGPMRDPNGGVRPFWTLDGVFGRLNRSQQQSIGLRPWLMMAQMTSSHLTAQVIAVIAARVFPSGQTWHSMRSSRARPPPYAPYARRIWESACGEIWDN